MKSDAARIGAAKRAKDTLLFPGTLLMVAIGLGCLVGLVYVLDRLEQWWYRPTAFAVLGPRPLPSLRELSLDDLERMASDAVVLIENQSGRGSAVIVAPNLLLSACHVGQENMIAYPADADPVHLRLAASLPHLDRCVFKAVRTFPHVVPGVRTASSLRPRERIYAFGYPSAVPTLSAGVFTNIFIDDDGVRMINANAWTAPGNSGGALFDRFGNVVGVIRSHIKGTPESYALVVDDWWEH